MTFDPATLDALAQAVADRIVTRLREDRERLLDRTELAARLDISTRQLDRMRREGRIPEGVLVGKVRKWDWRLTRRQLLGRKVRRRRKHTRQAARPEEAR